MGKHCKIRGSAKHAKPSKTNTTIKRVTVIGGGAITVPAAAFMFASPAGAATMSQWDSVSIPEAGGNWCIDYSGDGLSVGGLQFQNPSWHDALDNLGAHGINTSAWPRDLYQGMGPDNVPSKDQQILAGESLLQLQGPGAWANNNAGGISASMFNGGPNPWGLSGTSVPAGIELHASCTNATPTPPGPPPVPNPVPADGGQYAVVAGDTMFSIAAAHGISLDALIAANPQIANPDAIEIGDMLDIPGATPVPTPVPVPTPTPTPTPDPGHHWRHHHHWKHGDWYKQVPPVVPTDPAPAVAPGTCDHLVIPGDTVSEVAFANGASLADVEAVNPGIAQAPRPGDFSLIFPGGHIHMPAGFCDANQ